MKRIAPFGWILIASIAAPAVADDLKVGDKAPEFTLKGSDGKTYSLSDFKGKKAVVLAWFPKAFTGGCTAQCKSYGGDAAELKKRNVAYFTASVDDADTNAKFAKETGSNDYAILADPDKKVATAYGVLRNPGGVANRWTFYIDKDGIIREIDKSVKTATAAPDTVAKLDALGIAK
ncbi:MAG: peroxiredoxin [Isosphaeraceae bacterium]